MLLDDWLHEHGGIAHTSEIFRAGFSRHAVASAVSRRRMLRIRRSWIALPDCDENVVRAVRAGGVLTCLSQAARLGLWIPAADGETHVAAPEGSGSMKAPGLRIHWSRGPVPVPRRATSDPLLNVLHHVACCQSFPAALAIWESALNRGMITGDELALVHWQDRRARRLASTASGSSDSGLETAFVELLRVHGIAVRQQVWIDGRPVDVLIGRMLVVQLDGFAHHSDPASRRRDIAADARLRLRGYTVFRFDYQQVLFDSAWVLEIIQTALAQRVHEAPTGREIR